MLKQANILSYPVLVYHGERMINRDIPGNQFNHVIIAIPFDSSMIFFDPTGKQDFGYISSKISYQSQALLKGKEIIFYPVKSYYNNNQVIEKFIISQKKDSFFVHLSQSFTGVFNQSIKKNYDKTNEYKLRDNLERKLLTENYLFSINFSNCNINTSKQDTSFIEYFFSCNPVFFENDNKYYINLAFFGLSKFFLDYGNLKNKTEFRYNNYQKKTVIEMEIDKSSSMTFLPTDKELVNSIGTFKRNYSIVDNKLVVLIEQEMNSVNFNANSDNEKYNDLIEIKKFVETIINEFIVISINNK